MQKLPSKHLPWITTRLIETPMFLLGMFPQYLLIQVKLCSTYFSDVSIGPFTHENLRSVGRQLSNLTILGNTGRIAGEVEEARVSKQAKVSPYRVLLSGRASFCPGWLTVICSMEKRPAVPVLEQPAPAQSHSSWTFWPTPLISQSSVEQEPILEISKVWFLLKAVPQFQS